MMGIYRGCYFLPLLLLPSGNFAVTITAAVVVFVVVLLLLPISFLAAMCGRDIMSLERHMSFFTVI